MESIYILLISVCLRLTASFWIHNNNCHKPSVLIVGAGASGLSAARRLFENGITNVTILEAEDRIGGRINSVSFGDGMVDLGARWCHGEKGNIVYEMVKNLNLLGNTEYPPDMYYSDGTHLDDDLVDILGNIMDQLYLVDANYPKEYKSIGDYCEKNYKKLVEEKFRNDTKEFEIAQATMDYFEQQVISNEGSYDWYQSTARNDYVECEGNLEQNWKGKGYKTFLDVLLKKYPDPTKDLLIEHNILFNKEVIGISWRKEDVINGVTVTCNDNSTYTADHLIFTPSFGVLKATSDQMFAPQLPAMKKEAITNMGFGPVMKIVVKFNDRWWRKIPNGFNFIWSESDKMAAINAFPKGPSWKGRSWITYNTFSLAVENNPNVLVAWFTGPLIPEIERLSDEILKEGIYFIYNKFLGRRYNVTKPDQLIHSNWATNRHFRGSYSYQTEKATRGYKGTSANDDMAKPIRNHLGKPFLQFAGEGTHPHYFSNVHGAVESGFREGDRIVDWYQLSCKNS